MMKSVGYEKFLKERYSKEDEMFKVYDTYTPNYNKQIITNKFYSKYEVIDLSKVDPIIVANIKKAKESNPKDRKPYPETVNQRYDDDYHPSATKIAILNRYIAGRPRPQWLGFIHDGKPFKLDTHTFTTSDYANTDMIMESNYEKIFNPYLERSFQLKQSKTGLPSMEVFHGTIEENVESIAKNNFNWRLAGKSRGFIHGKGVCFSPFESFAYQFCGRGARIIQAKILCGRAGIGTDAQLLPPDGCDSTRSPNGNVFVKFEDDDFLPLCVSPHGPYDFRDLFERLDIND